MPAPSTEILSVDAKFDDIIGGLAITIVDERVRSENDRITVMVDLPHLERYGHQTTRELVYGCSFPVAVGDTVLCPPTPLYPKWTTGVVTALSGTQYRGRVKHVRKCRTSDTNGGRQQP